MWLHELLIYWNPNPNFIEIGSYSIKWYGVFWGASLMSCYFLAGYVFRLLNKDDDKLTIAIQYIFIGGLLGARLAHVLFYDPIHYLHNPLEIPAIWKGGLASHGGVAGGLLGLYLFCARNKEFNFFWMLDIGITSVLLLASLIRLGNLFNSELYGTHTNVPWAFVFMAVDDLPRHPVVLYESIAYFVLQILMIVLLRRYRETKPGLYLAFFLVSVFGIRFLLEFMKEPDGGLIFGLISKTQLLDLPFFITGLFLAWLVAKGKLHYAANPAPALELKQKGPSVIKEQL